MALFSGKVLNANCYNNNGGVRQYQLTGSRRQQWRFIKNNKGYWRIQNVRSGKCIAVYQGSHSNGASIIQV